MYIHVCMCICDWDSETDLVTLLVTQNDSSLSELNGDTSLHPPEGDVHVLILRISFGQKIFAYVVVLGEMSLIYWVGPESNEKCIHKRKAERYLRQTEGGKIQRRGGGSVTLEAENEQ